MRQLRRSRCATRKPLAFVDAYWDDQGPKPCARPPTGVISHHISPWGDIEPCPIIQFSNESIQ